MKQSQSLTLPKSFRSVTFSHRKYQEETSSDVKNRSHFEVLRKERDGIIKREIESQQVVCLPLHAADLDLNRAMFNPYGPPNL